MDCRKAEYLLHGYLDGELELAGSYEFERHIEECASCAGRLAKERALQARLAAAGLRFTSPPELRGKVAAALAESQPNRVRAARLVSRRALWVATVAASVFALAGLANLWRAPSTESLLAQQIGDAHVRSLMADHLEDVASSDQHTVKPWFSGRLEFSPWVADLADEGFPLRGGRLEYFDNHPVAAVVFQRRRHLINLFIWPSPGSQSSGVRLERRNGYQMLHWSAAGMTYWAVSDLNSGELHEFAALVQSRASQAQTPSPASAPVSVEGP